MPYPPSIQRLIDAFRKLPGVGPKTAVRYALFVVRNPKGLAQELAQSLTTARNHIVTCHICHTVAESDPCPVCADHKRQSELLCIVAYPQDLESIERTHLYQGKYHVLGGILTPTEGITPDQLNLTDLTQRITAHNVKEVIIALNPDLEGETTTLFLKKMLAPYPVRLTRLARGLPIGADIEYADEVTLRSALEGRNPIT